MIIDLEQKRLDKEWNDTKDHVTTDVKLYGERLTDLVLTRLELLGYLDKSYVAKQKLNWFEDCFTISVLTSPRENAKFITDGIVKFFKNKSKSKFNFKSIIMSPSEKPNIFGVIFFHEDVNE